MFKPLIKSNYFQIQLQNGVTISFSMDCTSNVVRKSSSAFVLFRYTVFGLILGITSLNANIQMKSPFIKKSNHLTRSFKEKNLQPVYDKNL